MMKTFITLKITNYFFDLLSKGYKIKTMKTSHYFLNIKNNISTNFKEEQAFLQIKLKIYDFLIHLSINSSKLRV